MSGVAGHAFGNVVRDVVNRIGGARVFRDPLRVQIHRARLGIHVHVLEHGAEHLGGCIDLRLALAGQPDYLGVAAALEVEDPLVGPAVLVVADQTPFRIGGQGRLSRAGETEEQRTVALLAHIGGAMHREHALQRQQVVQHAEDRFLELAGVARAADQNGALRKTHDDERARVRAMNARVRLKFGGVQHFEPRREAGQLPIGGTQEHVVDEERVPRIGSYEANRQTKRGVRARVHVAHE